MYVGTMQVTCATFKRQVLEGCPGDRKAVGWGAHLFVSLSVYFLIGDRVSLCMRPWLSTYVLCLKLISLRSTDLCLWLSSAGH